MTQLSIGDIQTMFQDCILEQEGEGLVIVREVVEKEDGIKLAVRRFGTPRNILIDPDPDMLFCPSAPYRLGYVQYREGASYLSRAPRRQYKVGWCQNNVGNLSLTMALQAGLTFVENLKGIFPSFLEAIELSKQSDGAVAFDRQFAVTNRGGVLAYKGQSISYIQGNDSALENGGYGHLRELFNKARNQK